MQIHVAGKPHRKQEKKMRCKLREGILTQELKVVQIPNPTAARKKVPIRLHVNCIFSNEILTPHKALTSFLGQTSRDEGAGCRNGLCR